MDVLRARRSLFESIPARIVADRKTDALGARRLAVDFLCLPKIDFNAAPCASCKGSAGTPTIQRVGKVYRL